MRSSRCRRRYPRTSTSSSSFTSCNINMISNSMHSSTTNNSCKRSTTTSKLSHTTSKLRHKRSSRSSPKFPLYLVYLVHASVHPRIRVYCFYFAFASRSFSFSRPSVLSISRIHKCPVFSTLLPAPCVRGPIRAVRAHVVSADCARRLRTRDRLPRLRERPSWRCIHAIPLPRTCGSVGIGRSKAQHSRHRLSFASRER